MYIQDSVKYFFNPSHEIWRNGENVDQLPGSMFVLLSPRDKSTKVLVLETQKPNMNHKSQAIK